MIHFGLSNKVMTAGFDYYNLHIFMISPSYNLSVQINWLPFAEYIYKMALVFSHNRHSKYAWNIIVPDHLPGRCPFSLCDSYCQKFAIVYSVKFL